MEIQAHPALGMCPFQVFPDEIWVFVIEELDDPNDINNVLMSDPQLAQLVNGKHFQWFIGNVMPWICSKYLSSAEVLTCRLVTKRWRSAINTCLETHPDRLPYKSSRIAKLTETHFQYGKIPRILPNISKILSSGYFDGITRPSLSNPVPGRYLEIFLVNRGCNFEPAIQNLLEALPVLQNVGHDIWYIQISLPSNDENWNDDLGIETVEALFECLQLLPNLKSLKLEGRLRSSGKEIEESAAFKRTFPFRLETLDIASFRPVSYQLGHFLLTKFVTHDGVQKLGVRCENWRMINYELFPNIIDLHTSAHSDIYSHHSVPNISRLLHGFRFARIQKLRIHNSVYLNITEIMEAIADYQIESLEIHGDLLEMETGNEPVTLNKIINLKLMVNPMMSFQFMKGLSSVQTISVISLSGGDWRDYSLIEEDRRNRRRGRDATNEAQITDHRLPAEDEGSSFGWSLQRFYEDMDNRWTTFIKLWSELPTLRMLTILQRDELSFQYVKESKMAFTVLNEFPPGSPLENF